MGAETPCRGTAEPVCSQSHCPEQCWAVLEGLGCAGLSPVTALCGCCSSCAGKGAGAAQQHAVFRRGAGDGRTSAWWSLLTLCKHNLLGLLHLGGIPAGNTLAAEPGRFQNWKHHELHQCLAILQCSPAECPTPWQFASEVLLRISAHRSCSYRAQGSLTLCHAQTLTFSQQTSHQLPVVILFTFFLF